MRKRHAPKCSPIDDRHDPDTVAILRKVRKAESLTGYAPWRQRKPVALKPGKFTPAAKSAAEPERD